MIFSPLDGVILKVPFHSSFLATKFSSSHSAQAQFPVKSVFGFGLRFLDREQQTQYLSLCQVTKVAVGVTAAFYTLKSLFALLD